LAIGTYFWKLVIPTLGMFFSPDDLMNLHLAWITPLGRLVRANILFFVSGPVERPLAEAWYRVVYELAGFRPALFHAALLVILVINIGLTYGVAARLSGRRDVGLVAAVLGAYSDRLPGLYFNTGYIFDVLCYFFFYSAFLLYIRVRQRNRFLVPLELVACCLFFCFALGSKEMAVTLPVFLLAYELLYHRPERWRSADPKQALPVFCTGLVALVFSIGRYVGPNAVTHLAAYHPHVTWKQFIVTSRHFLGEMTRMNDQVSAVAPLLLWGVLFAVAWIANSRTLKMAWFILMLAPLPVAFIDPRGPEQYYIPWFGWVLYAAHTLMSGFRMADRSKKRDEFWRVRLRGGALVATLVAALYLYYGRGQDQLVRVEWLIGLRNAHTVRQLHALHPSLARNDRVFFLNDPEPAGTFNMLFLTRLSYGARDLMVEMAKRIGRPSDEQLARYDYVFDYAGGRFFELHRPWLRPPSPAVWVDYFGGQFFHRNWDPVTADAPARRGEVVISKMADLGPTQPPIEPGRPFPQEPLLPVCSDVDVRVAGYPTEVPAKTGWPGEVNAYRVDFRVPPAVPTGPLPVTVSVNGITGPTVDLLVEERLRR
jgi:hypothetical protein